MKCFRCEREDSTTVFHGFTRRHYCPSCLQQEGLIPEGGLMDIDKIIREQETKLLTDKEVLDKLVEEGQRILPYMNELKNRGYHVNVLIEDPVKEPAEHKLHAEAKKFIRAGKEGWI